MDAWRVRGRSSGSTGSSLSRRGVVVSHRGAARGYSLARPADTSTVREILEAIEGQALFQEKCVACHTIGQGDRVGPDLAGVTARRSHAWLEAWIS